MADQNLRRADVCAPPDHRYGFDVALESPLPPRLQGLLSGGPSALAGQPRCLPGHPTALCGRWRPAVGRLPVGRAPSRETADIRRAHRLPPRRADAALEAARVQDGPEPVMNTDVTALSDLPTLPLPSGDVDAHFVYRALKSVERWVEDHNYEAYEPFDALSSPFARFTRFSPFLDRLLQQV